MADNTSNGSGSWAYTILCIIAIGWSIWGIIQCNRANEAIDQFERESEIQIQELEQAQQELEEAQAEFEKSVEEFENSFGD